MSDVNVRRLAAIDMYGSKGAPRRATIILIEFAIGAGAITLFGLWLATLASGVPGWLLAIWIIGIGTNYVPLVTYAVALKGPGQLSSELSGVDTAREIRRYGLLQLWILIPFSLLLFTLADLRSTQSQ